MSLEKSKENIRLNDETHPNYWDTHDSSEFLEQAETIKLEIARLDENCPSCGSKRLRKRMIDLPLFNDKILIKKVRILYCPDCNSFEVPETTLKELENTLKEIGVRLDVNTFSSAVTEGMNFYEKKWAAKRSERKNISIYFPTRSGRPAKAQVSLLITDRLCPVLQKLTSEDVRNLLNLQYYEDLEKQAKRQDRSISQFLKRELGRLLLEENPKIEDIEKGESSLRDKALYKDNETGEKSI